MKRILFVNQDMIPYVEETELSTMGKLIPQKIQEAGYEIRSFMPRWGNINERRGQLHEVIRLSGINIPINDEDHPLIIKVASIPQTRMQVYFIDNDEFFSRKGQTLDKGGRFYKDNGVRAIFFARGVIETIKKLRWYPDIIVCQGWMSAFVPLIVKIAYQNDLAICESKIIVSLCDAGPEKTLEKGLKDSLYFRTVTPEYMSKYKDTFNAHELSKIAIDNADGIVVDPSKVSEQTMAYIKESGKAYKAYSKDNAAVPFKKLIENFK